MQDSVLAPDFLDMAAFYLAVASVDKILTGDAAISGADLEKLSRHRAEGDVILRRVASSVDAGIDSIMREAAEKSKLRVKTRIDASLRGSPVAAYSSRSAFLEFFLPRLKSHSNVLRDVFGDDSAQAMKIVQAADTEEPAPRLFKLASIRMASGGKLSLLKKWTQEATSICGNPVSEIEEVAVDVAATDAILTRVAQNSRRLDAVDPTDPKAVELNQTNADLLEKVNRVAGASKDPAAVKAHAAAAVAKMGEKGGYVTKISAHLKMTPEQEDSMLVRGKAVIAAGAGSGKTRVLAGKVVHHIQDLGLDISEVMAVSFTRKASAELKNRIIDYAKDVGLNLPKDARDSAYQAIGTTHTIGRDVLKRSGRGYRVSGDKKDKDNAPITGSELSNIVKVAIAQVKMRAQGGASPAIPKSAMTFFPNPAPSAKEIEEPERKPFQAQDPALENKSPIQNPVPEASPIDYYLQDPERFKSVVNASIDTLTDFIKSIPQVRTFPKSQSGWYRAEIVGPSIDQFGGALQGLRVPGAASPMSYKPADQWGGNRFVAFSKTKEFNAKEVEQILADTLGVPQAKGAIETLRTFQGADPSKLTDDQKRLLEEIVSDRIVSTGLTRRNVLVKMASEEDDDVSEDGIETAVKRKIKKIDYEGSAFYHWLHNPANQWFNIGATEDDFKTEDAKGRKRDIPIGEFTAYIGYHKNSLLAPGALFAEKESGSGVSVGEEDRDLAEHDESAQRKRVFSAVYGAYEWLKSNIAQLKGRLDFDDQLVLSSRELIENPALLGRYQKQYKCILVDEAQDLNPAQHLLFGLLAGHIDPKTLKPRASGKMSADTFAFIGDDKQAIYEFRGANPSEFIEKSDLIPGGQGFTTKLLDTNFRSGSAIVDAANKLIAYNSKQIPMVCKTDPAKGEGSIQRVAVKDMDAANEHMVDAILAQYEEAKQDGDTKGFFKKFGLAVRTNKEIYGFAMKMIEKGIPFRSKKNFLRGPAISPILGLFAVTDKTSIASRNDGVIDGLGAPDWGLSPLTVRKNMDEMRVTDYYDFLVNQRGAKKVYRRAEQATNLQKYADYLKEIVTLSESGTASDIIDKILHTKGPYGDTFVDTLVASLMDDSEAMEEIQTEIEKQAEGPGKVTPEVLATYALAPIDPIRKAAARFSTSNEFVSYIKTLTEANKKNAEDDDVKADAVQIDTVHGWKGLEVDELFIPMYEGGFPHFRSATDPKMMESERRLAYVAFTRGRKNVTILEPQLSKGREVGPSPFVSEACIPLIGAAQEGLEPGGAGAIKTAGFSLPVFPPFDPPGYDGPMIEDEGSFDEGSERIEPVQDSLESQWATFALTDEEIDHVG